MTRKTKRMLVNICAVIFMTNMIIVPILAWYVDIELLKYLTISTMAFAIILLLFTSICKITKPKECYTNHEYNNLNSDFANKIPCNVWNRVLTSIHKVLKVFGSREITQQVSQTNNSTDNHSFHAGSLSQKKAGKQPNANKTQNNNI